MMDDPQASIKVVRNVAAGTVIPTKKRGKGFDGPGDCLRHVFDASWMVAGKAKNESWVSLVLLFFIRFNFELGSSSTFLPVAVIILCTDDLRPNRVQQRRGISVSRLDLHSPPVQNRERRSGVQARDPTRSLQSGGISFRQ